MPVRHLVVLLHGHGDDPADLVDRASRLVGPDTLLIAPAGPVTTVTGGPAWFPSVPSDVPDEAEAEPGLPALLDRLDPLLRALTAPHRIDLAAGAVTEGLVGYSQGAATALALAFRTAPDPRWRPPAVATIAGWLPHEPGVEWDLAGAAPTTRALLIHGVDDEVVDPQLGRGAARVLDRAGVAVTREDEPADHALTDAALGRALAFVTTPA